MSLPVCQSHKHLVNKYFLAVEGNRPKMKGETISNQEEEVRLKLIIFKGSLIS